MKVSQTNHTITSTSSNLLFCIVVVVAVVDVVVDDVVVDAVVDVVVDDVGVGVVVLKDRVCDVISSGFSSFYFQVEFWLKSTKQLKTQEILIHN